MPDRARWDFLKANATSTKPTIGELIDQAMIDIETENASLRGVLTKNYARQELDQTKLGEVLKLFSDIKFEDSHQGQDVLGRVYEYFLGEFAKMEGKRGGQYYTAGSVVKLLVEMLEPFKGRVYDPCCGSGGMFVQSERFVEEHGGRLNEISVYGQESNATTWRLAKMNLAIRGIEANLGPKWADTFHEDLHKGLMAKYVLANPPFNDSDWGGEKLKGDGRWKYGVPPAGNANFAWLQHIVHHLAPDGYAGVVLANGSLSSQQSGEGDIRRAMVEGVEIADAWLNQHIFAVRANGRAPLSVLFAMLKHFKPELIQIARDKQTTGLGHITRQDLARFQVNLGGADTLSAFDKVIDGASFQTMCESVGIDVIWAPVRTPEFKCHVEHAFHDLNQIYWHRLPSGIPHRPHVMAQLNLNPRSKVDRDLKAMSDGLWHAVRKMAFRVNSGIGMAPARAWMEGFREHLRPEVDDVTAFDGFLGKVRQCQLSTSGIKLENLRFHHPEITSGLLNDLLRYAKATRQRRAPMSSGTVMVTVVQEEFCDHIEVWNPRKRKNISLPCTLSEYSRGLTWSEHKSIREFAKKENLAFCSEDEMLEVSSSLSATYKSQIAELPYREARKLTRKYQPGHRLVPGSIVEEAWEDPSDTGMGSQGIRHIIPASRRTDARKIAKISRRGGADATKKAAAAKKRRRQQLLDEKAKPASPPEVSAKTDPKDGGKYSMWGVVEDSAERLARLAASSEASNVRN